MKTTLTLHTIANPRRTTLVHLEGTDVLLTLEQPEHSADLPARTANPRRTVLEDVPAGALVGE